MAGKHILANQSKHHSPVICNYHNKPIGKFQMKNALCAPTTKFHPFPGPQAEDSDIRTIVPGYFALEIVGEDTRGIATEKGLRLPGGVLERRLLYWSSSFESM